MSTITRTTSAKQTPAPFWIPFFTSIVLTVGTFVLFQDVKSGNISTIMATTITATSIAAVFVLAFFTVRRVIVKNFAEYDKDQGGFIFFTFIKLFVPFFLGAIVSILFLL